MKKKIKVAIIYLGSNIVLNEELILKLKLVKAKIATVKCDFGILTRIPIKNFIIKPTYKGLKMTPINPKFAQASAKKCEVK